jgi:hypothetical protein
MSKLHRDSPLGSIPVHVENNRENPNQRFNRPGNFVGRKWSVCKSLESIFRPARHPRVAFKWFVFRVASGAVKSLGFSSGDRVGAARAFPQNCKTFFDTRGVSSTALRWSSASRVAWAPDCVPIVRPPSGVRCAGQRINHCYFEWRVDSKSVTRHGMDGFIDSFWKQCLIIYLLRKKRDMETLTPQRFQNDDRRRKP